MYFLRHQGSIYRVPACRITDIEDINNNSESSSKSESHKDPDVRMDCIDLGVDPMNREIVTDISYEEMNNGESSGEELQETENNVKKLLGSVI